MSLLIPTLPTPTTLRVLGLRRRRSDADRRLGRAIVREATSDTIADDEARLASLREVNARRCER